MKPEINEHILVKILSKGAKVKDTIYRGYTRAQLATIGIDKSILKKAVKLGLVQERYVSMDKNRTMLSFYYVEVAPEVETKITPPLPESIDTKEGYTPPLPEATV